MSFLTNKNALAIDYGTKVIGLATYCHGRDPFPLMHGKIINKGKEQVFDDLKKVIHEECVEIVILGSPRMVDGRETDLTRMIRKFGVDLQASIEMEVHEQDETLSTFEAEKRMKESPKFDFKIDPKQIDALSAVIILEDFVAREDIIKR